MKMFIQVEGVHSGCRCSGCRCSGCSRVRFFFGFMVLSFQGFRVSGLAFRVLGLGERQRVKSSGFFFF